MLSRGSVDLVELLRAADQDLLEKFTHFYLPSRSPRILRRNALVALGNTGGAVHLPIVAGYLGNPDWLLRLHAAWAVRCLSLRLSLEWGDQVLRHAAARGEVPGGKRRTGRRRRGGVGVPTRFCCRGVGVCTVLDTRVWLNNPRGVCPAVWNGKPTYIRGGEGVGGGGRG